MKKEAQIPLIQPEAEPENCTHEWVKLETPKGKVLKCKYCGKIITE